jgi:Zn-dependent protease
MNNFTMKQIGAAIFTIAVYALIFKSLPVALILAGAVAWHEYCHIMAAKQMGMPNKGFFLLPFMGGVALIAGRYRGYAEQAYVVLAGPVGGGIGALATMALYVVLKYALHVDVPFLAGASFWMLAINLFNLLPFSFMDGGQLLSTITYSINRTLGAWSLIVSTMVAVVALFFMAPLLGLLILFFGGKQAYKEYMNWRAWKDGRTWLQDENWIRPPRKQTKKQILTTIGGWVGTAAILGAAMYLLQIMDPIHSTFSYFFNQ